MRNETSTGTIPAGVASDGTVQSVKDDVLKRNVYTAWVSGGGVSSGELKVYSGAVWENITGTNTTTPPDEDKTNWKPYQPERKKATWIYIPDDGSGNQKVARVEGVQPILDVNNETYSELYFMDRDITTSGAQSFQFVLGNLKSYSVDNNGGSDGVLGGETFVANEILNQEEKNKPDEYYDVVTFDATGTNFYIIENA